jgi:parallel beta-helix repeat protein
MPRSINPGGLNIGTGNVPQNSVPSSALNEPSRDSIPLKSHVRDDSRAHLAEAIEIEDAGGFYVSDDVEGALQEIGGGTGSTRYNGLIEGGTYTAVGLVVTLDSPTTALVGGGALSFGGASTTLTDSATNYLYIDASTGTLTSSTSLPTMESEDILLARIVALGGSIVSSEDGRWFVYNLDRKVPFTVRSDGTSANQRSEANFLSIQAALLYLELYATAGATSEIDTHRILVRGTNTISSGITITLDGVIIEGDGDAIFQSGAVLAPVPMFNLGASQVTFRNLAFVCNHATSRAIGGTANNLRVEDCFFLDGTNTWERCLDLTASSQGQVLRSFFQASDYGIRIDQAEECVIADSRVQGTAGSGTAGISLWDTTAPSARQGRCTLRNVSVDGYSLNVYLRGYGHHVLGCRLFNATTALNYAAGSSDPVPDHAKITDTTVALDPTTGVDGFLLDTLSGVEITACSLENSRTVWGGGDDPQGILLADVTDALISNTEIKGFYNDSDDLGNGVAQTGSSPGTQVVDCLIRGAKEGIEFNSQDALVSSTTIQEVEVGVTLAGNDNRMTGCQISTDSTRGLLGVQSTGDRFSIEGTRVENSRSAASYTAEVPMGIDLQGTGANVRGCEVSGFYNSVGVLGRGIYIQGTEDYLVQGNTLSLNRYGVEVSSNTAGVQIQNNRFGSITTAVLLGAGLQVSKVTGNYINGSEVTGTGISVSGADSANNRTVDLDISDNTIFAVTADGIRVTDYCWNILIENNNIDGYLGSNPFDPTADGIYVQNSAAEARYVTVRGNNVQRCQNGIILEGTSAFLMEDCQVSGNTIHHCAYAQASFTDTFASGSKGIGLNWANNCAVDGNHISEIGEQLSEAGTSNPPTAGGANVEAQGIYARNCSQLMVSGNVLDAMLSTGSGTGIGIFFANRSTGATSDFAGLNAVSNTVTGVDTYGIHLRADDGGVGSTDITVRDSAISDNQVRAVSDAGISVTLGDNSTINGLRVQDNTVQAVLTTSNAHLEVLCDSGLSTALVNVLLSGNQLIQPDVGPATTLMLVDGGAGFYQNLQIQGNQFQGNAVSLTALRLTQDGGSSNALEGCSISNNSFDGVYLRSVDVDLERVLGLAVQDNTFSDVQGEAAQIDADLFSDVTITGNSVYGSGSALTTGFYVLATTNTDVSTNLVIANNTIENWTNQGIRLFLSGQVFGGNISENALSQRGLFGSGSPGYQQGGAAIFLDMGATTLPVPGLANFDVRDNQITDLMTTGFRLDNTNVSSPLNGSLRNISIRNNSFYNVGPGRIEVINNANVTGGDTLTVNGTVLTAGTDFAVGGTATDTASNIVGALNTALPGTQYNFWNDGAVVWLMGDYWELDASDLTAFTVNADEDVFTILNDASAFNLRVEGNTFDRCAAEGYQDAIVSVGLYGDGSSYNSVAVCKNTLNSGPAGGIRIFFTDLAATYAQKVVNLRVDDNILNWDSASPTTATAISIDLDGADDVLQVSASRNQVRGASWNNGILVNAGSLDSGSSTYEDIKVNGNSVQGMAALGIQIEYPTNDGIDCYSIQANNNTVVGAGSNGIVITGFNPPTDAGGNGTAFDLFNVTVSNNNVRDCGGHGIRLVHDVGDAGAVGDSFLRHVVMTGNISTQNGSAGTTGATSFNGGLHNMSLRITGESGNIVASSNHLNNGTAYGFFVDLGDGDAETSVLVGTFDSNQGNLDAIILSNNVARSNGSAVAASMTDAGQAGTNYSTSDGALLGNISQSTSGGGNNTWPDVAAVGWTSANNSTT